MPIRDGRPAASLKYGDFRRAPAEYYGNPRNRAASSATASARRVADCLLAPNSSTLSLMPQPTFTLPSPQTGTEYAVYVLQAAESDHGPVPAVLFMDGDDQFDAATEAYRVALARGEVAPLLLVGVGYGATYTSPLNRRVRDYTPTAMPTEHGSGAAEDFHVFLTTTLWRELSERYAVRADLRGIAGHSLGSLFVIHALLKRKPFFHRFLASAPSLWWDDRSILCAAEKLQRTGVALPARLFLSCGTDDTVSTTTDLEQFEDQLNANPFPELEVVSQRFRGRNHYNVLPDAFGAGLRALFPPEER